MSLPVGELEIVERTGSGTTGDVASPWPSRLQTAPVTKKWQTIIIPSSAQIKIIT